MKKYRVLFDGIDIGTLLESHQDFPWSHGVFEANKAYSEVEELFKEEVRLLETDEAAWNSLWDEISHRGLHLEAIPGGEKTESPLLHISGNEAWWRT